MIKWRLNMSNFTIEDILYSALLVLKWASQVAQVPPLTSILPRVRHSLIYLLSWRYRPANKTFPGSQSRVCFPPTSLQQKQRSRPGSKLRGLWCRGLWDPASVRNVLPLVLKPDSRSLQMPREYI